MRNQAKPIGLIARRGKEGMENLARTLILILKGVR